MGYVKNTGESELSRESMHRSSRVNARLCSCTVQPARVFRGRGTLYTCFRIVMPASATLRRNSEPFWRFPERREASMVQTIFHDARAFGRPVKIHATFRETHPYFQLPRIILAKIPFHTLISLIEAYENNKVNGEPPPEKHLRPLFPTSEKNRKKPLQECK